MVMVIECFECVGIGQQVLVVLIEVGVLVEVGDVFEWFVLVCLYQCGGDCFVEVVDYVQVQVDVEFGIGYGWWYQCVVLCVVVGIYGQYWYVVVVCVLQDLVGCIEFQWLVVDQVGGECGWVVVFELVVDIGDQCKVGGMVFWEVVVVEVFDLFEQVFVVVVVVVVVDYVGEQFVLMWF